MNAPLSFNLRGSLANEFSALRARALRASLWAKLTGKNTKLAKFPEGAFPKGLNRKSVGVKDIPLAEIVGTLYRHSDFDDKFRPLKKNLRDRWINIYLLHSNGGWPPILVHKIGEHYYVEDGHHRVSVALALGIVFIEATVWEYPCNEQPSKKCDTTDCKERNLLKQYVTVTENCT